MSTEPIADDERKKNRYQFDRHTPEYRHQFEAITAEMLDKCPMAWSDTYDGHWVAAGHHEVFELARSAEYLSNDHDVSNERRGYKGITIPSPKDSKIRGGFLEMDPPEQRHVIQGMQHLPATFTPGPAIGDGLDETIARMQVICDEQRLAEPVTVRTSRAKITH